MENLTIKCICLLVFFSPVFAIFCDDQTQYEKEGRCCKMCEPGTRMVPSDCLNPVCSPCGKDEYMEYYNNKTACNRQPYCDKNLNFNVSVTSSPTKFRPCTCKTGYHCSSEQCFSCIEYTLCKPGEGVVTQGSAIADTVCRPCQSGTFSNQKSAVDSCRPWTNCSPGFQEKVPGTNVSDRVCEAETRWHYFGIPAAIFIFAVILFIFYKKKDQVKKLLLCSQKKQAQQDYNKNHTIFQETETGGQAEETDEPEPLIQDHLTDNKNPVAQEEGKRDHTPMTESSPV